MDFQTEVVDAGDLTPREAGVFGLLCSALSDKAIAQALELQIGTVNTHVDHIYCKLGVQNDQLNRRMAAMRVALNRGMIRLHVTHGPVGKAG